MQSKKAPRFRKRWLILVIVLLALFQLRLPVYYSAPGGAEAIAPFVHVEGGYKREEGSLLLTTVLMGKANPYLYLWAFFSDYRTLIPERQIVQPGESDEDYFHRQQMMMESSQDAAKIVAYKKAGKEVNIEYKGVRITSLIDGMPAKQLLRRDDRIIAVDGTKVNTVEEVNGKVASKTAGDTVMLTVIRDNEERNIEVPLAPFPEGYSNERIGLGVLYPVTERELDFEPEVEIDVENIGGPSAGLMFSLEIYNQLVEEDITKGYIIAGTGTLDEEGTVGRIGGIKQKVMAAHKAGVDIFLAPKEGGRENANYYEALSAAEEIGTTMKIIGVDTFDEALQSLEKLTPKRTEN